MTVRFTPPSLRPPSLVVEERRGRALLDQNDEPVLLIAGVGLFHRSVEA